MVASSSRRNYTGLRRRERENFAQPVLLISEGLGVPNNLPLKDRRPQREADSASWLVALSTPDGPRDAALHVDEDGHVDGFECFHASHADKKLGDVGKLFGLRGSREGFDVDSKDNVIANSQKNIRRAISKLGIELTHDVFAQKLLATQDSNTAPLEDALLVRCWLLIDETFGFRPSYEFFEKVVTDTARKHPFHPVCDYLGNLVWDGTARIDTWLSAYAKAADDAYTQAVGALVLIAAVRRVRNPGCKFDEMLVLESGEQGVFKSTALRTLCPREEWFSDDLPLNVDSKQIERTSGKWFIEAPDLAGMRPSEVEHLKAMLSRQVDGPVRMAYDRLPKEQPRHFVIVGTTNTMSGYRHRPTGPSLLHRRHLPVRQGRHRARGYGGTGLRTPARRCAAVSGTRKRLVRPARFAHPRAEAEPRDGMKWGVAA